MSPVPSVIGPYRVERELARGGMGVLYLATDTRLDRRVALKALPEDFASDPDRLLRFEREAKVLAALSHPNLAGIYGVEEVGGRRYLALEYVDGETLAARIARGPLPVADAVEICLQIASGLEAAHESGIVHRDLKPGNVMITPGDVVKVVDFGLAKGRVAEPGTGDSPALLDSPASPDAPTVTESPALAHSPTIGTPATLPGVILGTAAYLSPEQARGKVVDRRTDIWSFGCVLYECLTGRRAFEGETVSDVVAAILSREVEWRRLPRGTPSALRALLQRCLEKDPRKRLRDIGEARLTLEEIREGRASADISTFAPRGLPARKAILGAILLVGAVAVGITLWNVLGPGRSGPGTASGARRYSISLPQEFKFVYGGLSFDGRFVWAFGFPRQRSGDEPAKLQIYRRPVDGSRFEPVAGTEGFGGYNFSKDGRWLYYGLPLSDRSAERRVMKVLLEGSAAPVAVANWDPAWEYFCPLGNGDVLVSTQRGKAYLRLPAGGGAPSAPIKFYAPGFTGSFDFQDWNAPHPDRWIFVGTTYYEQGEYHRGIGVLEPASGRVRILLRDGGCPTYSPTGHLLFTRGSTLLAAAFDVERAQIRGEPVALMDGLRNAPGTDLHAGFGLSRDGTLSYLPGGMVGARRGLIVVDGQGRMSDWTPDRAPYKFRIVAAPTGDRVATSAENAKGLDEVWISRRGAAATERVLSAPGQEVASPAWSPNGEQIAYAGTGGIWVQALEGGRPPRLISREDSTFGYTTLAWSPDGSTLLGTMVKNLPSGVDIVRIPVPPEGGAPSDPVPLVANPVARERRPSFSPDGRWITYDSNESGTEEVYVAPYRQDGTVGTGVRISPGGGYDSRWSRTGRAIFYQTPEGSLHRRVMSVSLRFQPTLSASEPVARWDFDQLRIIEDGGLPYDVLPGDEIVAIQKGEEEDEVTRVEVVLNFFDELKQKMRAAGVR